ncbi:ABC transporter permease [Epibacterium sp. Ofav1-8]|uniref:ABC transporter permease n=1 Tax=Epibacterium sp. Ofav1-8 TaxID=2917735 RepID=UPI001EF3FAFF|nr:ABC transporter permease [Epibacterium sp. Ofav1-8]MCG7625857.1 ABC transporter permease [Epibacterium sp. Ofav1-8]
MSGHISPTARQEAGAAAAPAGVALTLLRSLVHRIAVFGFLLVLMSVLPRLLPGDTLDVLMDSDVQRELADDDLHALRDRLGFGGSLAEQVGRDLLRLLRGDLGYSLLHGAPVRRLLAEALPWTGLLIAAATPVFLGLGIMLGVEAGRQPGSRADRVLTAGMSLLASIPPFVTAIALLLVFAILCPVLPAGGAEPLFPAATPWLRAFEIARHAVLPALALALHEVVRYFFVLRGEAAVLSHRAFVVNARSRGISGWRERRDYFSRNLLPVICARLGQSVATLFTASLFVEVIFAYPGIGSLTYQAVLDRDYALLQGAIAVLAALVLSLNWLFDALTETLARRG